MDSYQSEIDALRSEVAALRRMIAGEPEPDDVIDELPEHPKSPTWTGVGEPRIYQLRGVSVKYEFCSNNMVHTIIFNDENTPGMTYDERRAVARACKGGHGWRPKVRR